MGKGYKTCIGITLERDKRIANVKKYPMRIKDTIDVCKYEKGIQMPLLMSLTNFLNLSFVVSALYKLHIQKV